MRAYEFLGKTSATGTLELPDTLAGLPPNETVRVIVLVPEPTHDDDLAPEEEDALWQQHGLAELARHYGPEDAVYDDYQP